jgi:hypothetical protein
MFSDHQCWDDITPPTACYKLLKPIGDLLHRGRAPDYVPKGVQNIQAISCWTLRSHRQIASRWCRRTSSIAFA